jgi:probable O-sialoglycoprotein endopeptidase
VGKTVAYELGAFFEKEVIPVHHISGHIFSILLERKLEDLELPLVVLTVSGGHNDIYLITQAQQDTPDSFSEYTSFSLAGFRITKI